MARALDVEDMEAVVSGRSIYNLKFADDIGLLTESLTDLQSLLDRVDAESNRFGLTISRAMTEVQCIPPEGQPLLTNIGGVTLKQTKDFVYLGGKISDTIGSGADVERRIDLAMGVARSMAEIWKAKDTMTSTKVRLYNTLALSVLLYNAETWTIKEELRRKLLVFEMTVLQRIAGVTRWGRCRNADIRVELGIGRDVVNRVRSKRLSYFGHVVRMQPTRTYSMEEYTGDDRLADPRKGGWTTSEKTA